jgi:hypothetical protein
MVEQPGQLIDAYLDDLLDETERAAFERRLESDARLRAEVEGQRRIDGALGRLFAPPLGDGLASRIATLAATDRRPVVRMPARVSRWRRFAIAAALVIGVVGLYRLWDFVRPSQPTGRYAPQAWRSFETVYRDTVSRGFKPNWVCKNDREFVTAFRRQLGQALLLLPPPPGVAWAGLDYCNSITPQTMFLLAWVQGEKVLVLADQAASDRGQTLPPESRLHLFRRQVGNLVLYECTPLDQPYVLDNFYIPDLWGP